MRERRGGVSISANENNIRNVTSSIDEKKANLAGDIPAKLRKVFDFYIDSYITTLTKILNASLDRDCHPK